MGRIAHDAVLVTAFDPKFLPDIAAFRDSLPEQWRPLVVGPVGSVVNCYAHAAFLPDGSKEGWADSNDGERYREAFIALFSGRYMCDVVTVRYGGDEDSPAVTEVI